MKKTILKEIFLQIAILAITCTQGVYSDSIDAGNRRFSLRGTNFNTVKQTTIDIQLNRILDSDPVVKLVGVSGMTAKCDANPFGLTTEILQAKKQHLQVKISADVGAGGTVDEVEIQYFVSTDSK